MDVKVKVDENKFICGDRRMVYTSVVESLGETEIFDGKPFEKVEEGLGHAIYISENNEDHSAAVVLVMKNVEGFKTFLEENYEDVECSFAEGDLLAAFKYKPIAEAEAEAEAETKAEAEAEAEAETKAEAEAEAETEAEAKAEAAKAKAEAEAEAAKAKAEAEAAKAKAEAEAEAEEEAAAKAKAEALAKKQALFSSANNELDELKKELALAQKQLKERDAKIAALNKEANSLQMECCRYTKQLSELATGYKTLEGTNQKLNIELTKVLEQNLKFREEIKTLKATKAPTPTPTPATAGNNVDIAALKAAIVAEINEANEARFALIERQISELKGGKEEAKAIEENTVTPIAIHRDSFKELAPELKPHAINVIVDASEANSRPVVTVDNVASQLKLAIKHSAADAYYKLTQAYGHPKSELDAQKYWNKVVSDWAVKNEKQYRQWTTWLGGKCVIDATMKGNEASCLIALASHYNASLV